MSENPYESVQTNHHKKAGAAWSPKIPYPSCASIWSPQSESSSWPTFGRKNAVVWIHRRLRRRKNSIDNPVRKLWINDSYENVNKLSFKTKFFENFGNINGIHSDRRGSNFRKKKFSWRNKTKSFFTNENHFVRFMNKIIPNEFKLR